MTAQPIAPIDNFFRRTANKLTRAGNLRTFVMVSPAGELIGFYAANAHAVDYAELPDRFARNRPAHGSILATYITMIGADRRSQGRGYGDDLLVDCLVRLAGAADALGIAVVLLDVFDCGDPPKGREAHGALHQHGFEPLPSNALWLFLPMATVRTLTGA
jgi:GNAT superfamily N-acetyltransferase